MKWEDKYQINSSNLGGGQGDCYYVLFVEGKPCGVIEAKREEEVHRMNVYEKQGEEYANAKPGAREVFSFHRPETLKYWQISAINILGKIQIALKTRHS